MSNIKTKAASRTLADIIASGELENLKEGVREKFARRRERVLEKAKTEPKIMEYFGQGKQYGPLVVPDLGQEVEDRVDNQLLANPDISADEFGRTLDQPYEPSLLKKTVDAGVESFDDPDAAAAFARRQLIKKGFRP